MNQQELNRRITEEQETLQTEISRLSKLAGECYQQIDGLQNSIYVLQIDPVFYFQKQDGVVK